MDDRQRLAAEYGSFDCADAGRLFVAGDLGGLVRYDGVRFSVFNKSNTQGIESNRFTHLAVDGKGDL